ncbi:Energy-coupling factor transporter ATP-binding protein EcfA1 [compost metagenome]
MLDEKARGELLQIWQDMRRSGDYTLISITHDAEEIMASDRAIVLRGGAIAADMSPAQLFEDEEMLQACRLIAPYRVRLLQELRKRGIAGDDILRGRHIRRR